MYRVDAEVGKQREVSCWLLHSRKNPSGFHGRVLHCGECVSADDASVFLFLFCVLMVCKPPGSIPSPTTNMLGHGVMLVIGKLASEGDVKEEPSCSGLVTVPDVKTS